MSTALITSTGRTLTTTMESNDRRRVTRLRASWADREESAPPDFPQRRSWGSAVLVGGTTFGSVHGSYTRTAIGALLLTLLATILIGEGFTEGESRVLYGLIILAVMAIYGREARLRDRF